MAEGLTSDQLRTLRERLERRLAVLEEAVRQGAENSSSERIGQYSGEVHDRGEEASVDSMAEVNSAVLGNLENERRLVKRALERMDAEEYGECQDCGADIGFGRLEASPHAIRCVACQQRLEGRR